MDTRLEDKYRLEIGSGFSTLERVGDEGFRTDPNQSYEDTPYTDIYEDAVYGGKADPSLSQHFYIYRVDWPDEVEEPRDQDVEDLSNRLDSVFEGWIVNEEGDRVFALRRKSRR